MTTVLLVASLLALILGHQIIGTFLLGCVCGIVIAFLEFNE